MSYVITQNCCKDASCVAACPVNCIHPAPGETGFGSAPMLYVDARACIDCGACADACPVDAVVPADTLVGPERVYLQVNARHYGDTAVAEAGPRAGPLFRQWQRPTFDWSLPSDFAGLDVAVVGTGPAGLYAAEMLLLHSPSTVTLIDRLPVAGGLVRYGVAPDHPGTKRVGQAFARLYSHPRVRMALGVEVGTAVPVDELGRHFDAVVYAVGASVGKQLGVPGESLPGVVTAPRFVGWYNAHPDIPADTARLDHERVVVVGNGNVAMDIARVLTTDPDELARTDIAEHALSLLRTSAVREVVLLGRRGPEHAAFTEPELLALRELPGVELVVDDTDPRVTDAIDGGSAPLLQGLRRTSTDLGGPPAPGRRIVLRFHSVVDRVLGDRQAEGVLLDDGSTVTAGPVVTAIGYGGVPLPGLPFHADTGTAPNEHGRVDGVPGAYVVGWFKRGSSGGIGDNRADAEDTVRTLLQDAVAGRLPSAPHDSRAFLRSLRRRTPELVDARGLDRILAAERAQGERSGRAAAKFATVPELQRAARR